MTIDVWDDYASAGPTYVSSTVGIGDFSWPVFDDATVKAVNTPSYLAALGSQTLVRGISTIGFRDPYLHSFPETRYMPANMAAVLRAWQNLAALTSPTAIDEPSVKRTIAWSAFRLLSNVIARTAIEPTFHPLADGGVLAKWEAPAGTLHIEFDDDGDTVMLLDDTAEGVRSSGYLPDYQAVAWRWLARQVHQ